MNFILKHKSFAFVLLLFIFFHEFWISLYYDLVVDKILLHASRSIWVDLAIFLIICFAIWWLSIKLKKSFFLKSDSLVIPGVILIGYLVVRLLNSEELLANWTFRNCNCLKGIRYFDSLFVFCLVPFVLRFYGVKKSSDTNLTSSLKPFTNDDPIKTAEMDVLNLQQRSLQVYSMLKSCRGDKSVAIGIVGSWGQGKSSFMNLVEERFKDDEDYIIIHFNSWLNISARSIIHDFFNTLEEQLAPYGLDIANEIKRYGNKVLSVYKSSTAESVLNGLALFNESSLSKEYRELNKKLNVLDKSLLVFFDDLDRLQPDEVFEALKLIRNTASFDVCNYVVGYDRSYINVALEKCGIPNAERYCEKIFLKEFPLLPVSEKQIRDFLSLSFVARIPDAEAAIKSFFSGIERSIQKKKRRNPFASLRNLRDAKRFVNEVVVSIQHIDNEVDISEFILVKLLKFSYYDVYRLLYNKEKFIDASNAEHRIRRDDRPGKLKLRPVKGNTFLSSKFSESILEKEVLELGIYNGSLEDIDTIVTRIFNVGILNNNFGMVSLCYGNNYYKYFRDEIDPLLYKKEEFDHFIKSDLKEMTDIVDSTLSLGKLEGLVDFIYRFKYDVELTSKDQYKNFVHILFYIARLPVEFSKSEYFGIEKEYIYEVLKNENCKKSFFSDKDKIDTFILDKFWNNFNPSTRLSEFEPDFLRHHFEKRNNPELPFSREKYIEYLERFMEIKTSMVQGIDSEFWYCYKLCFIKVSSATGRGLSGKSTETIRKNKDKFLLELLPKFLDEFLVDSLKVSFDKDTGKKFYSFSRSREINSLFGSSDDFRAYLISVSEDDKYSEFPVPFVGEFLGFYKQFPNSQDVEYYFQYAPIRDKLEN